MPYIDEQARQELCQRPPNTSGELSYVITRIVATFLARTGGPRYQDFNDALGALEGAKLELYARLVRPYEDGKKVTNGDVY